jgi:SOS-response transcriptional repressor LexA
VRGILDLMTTEDKEVITVITDPPKLGSTASNVLHYINEYWNENEVPPSIREIQRNLGIISSSVVQYHVERLERLGYLKRIVQNGRTRGFRVIKTEA